MITKTVKTLTDSECLEIAENIKNEISIGSDDSVIISKECHKLMKDLNYLSEADQDKVFDLLEDIIENEQERTNDEEDCGTETCETSSEETCETN